MSQNGPFIYGKTHIRRRKKSDFHKHVVNKISLFVMESAVLIGTSRGLAVNNDHGLYMETEWIHTVSVIILYLPPSLWRE